MTNMMQFGSWKSRGKVVMVNEDYTMSESIEEEEFTAFLRRQTSTCTDLIQINQAKQLPSWMKTTSLNRCNRTPPLPPKAKLPRPTPPPRTGRRARGFLGSSDLPPSTSSISTSTCSQLCQPSDSSLSSAGPLPVPIFPRVNTSLYRC